MLRISLYETFRNFKIIVVFGDFNNQYEENVG